MADVTDQDRAKAIDVLASARADVMWLTDTPVDLLTRIAEALAEARETGYGIGWNEGSTDAAVRSW